MFLLNGVELGGTSQFANTPGGISQNLLSIDGVREFNLLTDTYSARIWEAGRRAGEHRDGIRNQRGARIRPMCHEGQKYKVLAADYHPGRGKMGGVTHVRLQNLSTATFWEFMNPESYEQTEIEKSVVGPQAEFLLPGMKLSVEFVEGRRVLFSEFAEINCRRYGSADSPARQHVQDRRT